MDMKDIPSTDFNEPDELDFDTLDDMKKIRKAMLNSVYKALHGEPNAQVIRAAQGILNEAGVEMLDTEKAESEVVSFLESLNDDELADSMKIN